MAERRRVCGRWLAKTGLSVGGVCLGAFGRYRDPSSEALATRSSSDFGMETGWHVHCGWLPLFEARGLQISAKIPQLSFGIPIGRTWNAFARPRHTSLNPILSPLVETDSSVVVVVTELKTARWTDFVGSAAVCMARLFGEVRKTANRAKKRCIHNRSRILMGRVFRVDGRNTSGCSA